MIRFIKNILFQRNLKKVIANAISIADKTGRKQLVIIFNSKPVVLSKQDLTRMIRQGKFQKGVSVQDIEKKALFITKP
jgi:hypothetical protein